MTADTILRPVGSFDAMVIAALHRESFGEQPWDEPAVAEILAMPGAFGYLLLQMDGPAGFVIGRVAADECEILSLGVRPERRRQGFGHRLLEAALDRAAAAGSRMVHLEVSEANCAGRRLYESQGFQRNGQGPDYYATDGGTAATALLLSRRLS
jgi:ribosomal-protein-alanine N-acetyltransferase